MSPGLFSAPLRVLDLFSEPFRFSVPAYQRRYSWTVKEASQLLDDLLLAIGPDRDAPAEPDYFLGAILLTDTGSDAAWGWGSLPRTPRQLDIVDGQQRLITLTLLLAVLRDLASENGEAIAGRLTGLIELPPGPADGQRGYRLQLRGSDDHVLATHVMAPGACCLPVEADLSDPSSQAILDVRDHFLGELVATSPEDREALLSYVLERCHVVAIVTTDIDRGHRLFAVLNDRGRPLARKDIIKAEILGGVPAELTEAAQRSWDEIERRLGSEFDAFFSHLKTVCGKAKLPIIAGIRAARSDAGGSEPFLSRVLLPLADAYEIICRARHEGAAQSEAISRHLGYLSWLGSSEWVPATLQCLDQFRNQPAQILSVIAAIDRFSYALRLLCIGVGKRTARFSGVLSALSEGIVLDRERSPLTLTRDEQRHITYNLRNLHERHPQTCKLVLLRLNDELAGGPQNLNALDWTVEHVLPQNPGRNGRWRDWFPEVDERERLTQSLGNLVLVKRSQNDKASNQDFARKKAIYFKPGDADVPAITREIKDIAEWTPGVIKEREARFLGIIAQMWDLDLSALQGVDGQEARTSGRRARRARKPAEDLPVPAITEA